MPHSICCFFILSKGPDSRPGRQKIQTCDGPSNRLAAHGHDHIEETIAAFDGHGSGYVIELDRGLLCVHALEGIEKQVGVEREFDRFAIVGDVDGLAAFTYAVAALGADSARMDITLADMSA